MRRLNLILLGLALVSAGCSNNNFDPGSEIESVRILATRAEPPYAAPGATVRMDTLAFDGRAKRLAPMVLSWIPIPCINPAGDAFYACFPRFAEAFHPGVDLTPALTSGTSFSFQMPSNVIATHLGSRGQGPYGLAVVFTIACAGHVEYMPPAAGASPDALPFGCFDAGGAALGPNDFVFAYALVYAFTGRTNANPVIDHVTFGGAAVDADAGIAVAHCTKSSIDACPATDLQTILPDSDQELDPGDTDTNGNVLKEEVWVDYYVTAGKVKNDTIVVFDPHTGRLANTADPFYSPQSSGASTLWAVAHDNRGGVSWVELGVHAR